MWLDCYSKIFFEKKEKKSIMQTLNVFFRKTTFSTDVMFDYSKSFIVLKSFQVKVCLSHRCTRVENPGGYLTF
jgi:hypothetical protein